MASAIMSYFFNHRKSFHLLWLSLNKPQLVFTALHVMQRSIVIRILSVRPSVRLPHGREICPDFYTIRKNIYPSFLRRRMVDGGDPFYLKFWVNRPPLERNHRFSTNNRL